MKNVIVVLLLSLLVGCEKSEPIAEIRPDRDSDIESGDNLSRAEAESDDGRETGSVVTVSLAQMKEWAESLSEPPGNLTRNLTHRLEPVHPLAAEEQKITYLGSTSDYHYFTYPKPYYRVSRREWPALKSEFGAVIDDPKDLPHRTLWLNNEMTLDVAHPHFIPFFFEKKNCFESMIISSLTNPDRLKITAKMPHQLSDAEGLLSSETLIGVQLFHRELPPSNIAYTIDGQVCQIEFTIEEKWFKESRLVLHYSVGPPTSERYVFDLSEFVIDKGRENTSIGPFSEWPSRDSTGGMQLRYGFVPGQRMNYMLRNEIEKDIVNLNQKTTMNLDVYFSVTVDAVEADGSAVMTQINDRYTFKLKRPDGTIISHADFLSDERALPELEELRQEFRTLQSAHCTYRVTPSGVVRDVQPAFGPIGSVGLSEPSMPAGFTQTQLEQTAMALFHPMPEGPVESGATWSYTRNADDLKRERVFTKTFVGIADDEGRQSVEITGTVVTKKAGFVNPASDDKVDDELSTWQEYFDPKLGWLVSMNDVTVRRTKQKIMGMDVETKISTKVSIQLQPAVDTRAPRMPLRIR